MAGSTTLHPSTGSTAEPTRVERWERRAEVPMLLLSFAFVGAYAWTVIDPSLSPTLERFLLAVSWTTWFAFAVDFAIRIALAEHRLRYILRHWYDVLLVALPMFRALRLLRILGTLRILNRVFQQRLIGRTGAYVVLASVFCIFFGSLAVLDVEQEAAGSQITTFGDALWWAVVTSTTVGYGDLYPVTDAGRAVAVGLMILGIALLGAVTASMAAWLVSAVEQDRTRRAEADAAADARAGAGAAEGAGASADADWGAGASADEDGGADSGARANALRAGSGAGADALSAGSRASAEAPSAGSGASAKAPADRLCACAVCGRQLAE